jgi:hypothetical protein
MENTEKIAIELVDRMRRALCNDDTFQAKQCALVASDEAQKAEYNVLIKFNIVTKSYDSNHWQQVKNEIDKIK